MNLAIMETSNSRSPGISPDSLILAGASFGKAILRVDVISARYGKPKPFYAGSF